MGAAVEVEVEVDTNFAPADAGFCTQHARGARAAGPPRLRGACGRQAAATSLDAEVNVITTTEGPNYVASQHCCGTRHRARSSQRAAESVDNVEHSIATPHRAQ